MKALVIDCEMNALVNPDKVHVVCVKEIETQASFTFLDMNHLKLYLKHFDTLIGHNISAYDIPHLERILDIDLSKYTILDTLVMSKLYDYNIEGGHSLKAWGQRLGNYKGDFSGPWDVCTQEMIDYCVQDVEVTYQLYQHLIKKMPLEQWKDAFTLEAFISRKCFDMNRVGFGYNKEMAEEYKAKLDKLIKEKDEKIEALYPPTVITGRTHKRTGAPLKDIVVVFNPGSNKEVIDKLWEAGWQPTEKTDGHKEFLQEGVEDTKKKERYDRYGWKLSEENLATLPEDAPEAIRTIIHRMILVNRRRKLDEWDKGYNPETKAVHGHLEGIGTWTHRMAHSKPNLGNVSAKKSIKYKTPELKELATFWGGEFRKLWQAREGTVLVGTDAEGIQLRVLAHYMNDPEFTYAVTSGSKEDGTDPHTMNMKRLGDICPDRDKAKTFIYAFLLGAGDAKVGEIFGVSSGRGRKIKEGFTNSYAGLAKLKNTRIPAEARKGMTQALDGRLIRCDSKHLMMATYLQTSEAIIMKLAVKIACEYLDRRIKEYRLVNIIHDEMIFETLPEFAELVKSTCEWAIKTAGEVLKLNVTLKGEGKIGKTWLDTH